MLPVCLGGGREGRRDLGSSGNLVVLFVLNAVLGASVPELEILVTTLRKSDKSHRHFLDEECEAQRS